MDVSIDINVKMAVEPWMFKYLSREFGPSPYRLSRKVYNTKLLFVNLNRKSYFTKKPISGGSCEFVFVIPWHHVRDYNVYTISDATRKQFLEFYHEKFNYELYLWVRSRRKLMEGKHSPRNFIVDSIEEFIGEYDINYNDIQLDALKKRLYREGVRRGA